MLNREPGLFHWLSDCLVSSFVSLLTLTNHFWHRDWRHSVKSWSPKHLELSYVIFRSLNGDSIEVRDAPFGTRNPNVCSWVSASLIVMILTWSAPWTDLFSPHVWLNSIRIEWRVSITKSTIHFDGTDRYQNTTCRSKDTCDKLWDFAGMNFLECQGSELSGKD
jgi:hypothetical protein